MILRFIKAYALDSMMRGVVWVVIRERRTPPAELGPMLRQARERAGLGLREVARAVDLSPGYLWHLEAAERCPSVTVAHRLAAVLEFEETELAQLLAAAVDDAGRDHPSRIRVA
ncbi:helix-turn-helix transcriptional regulator [Streptomyces sp. NPDC005283]|uniref:helix-turn-helix domain-containing protein n=1 Tax=Streptomyces sp. NPDC005283 TaxID=3156871 RepID=UPI00345689F6